ncbi:MAG: archease [Chloroflexi bacterium]|nr:archease [Chloroflexota bacterium]
MFDFQVIDHTADVGLVARGRNLKEALVNAAGGMFSLICDLDTVAEEVIREVTVMAEDETSLLAEWLEELLYLSEVRHVLWKRFDISHLTPKQLRATVYGSSFDPARHTILMHIKAVTHHLLQVVRDNGYRVQVIFDI